MNNDPGWSAKCGFPIHSGSQASYSIRFIRLKRNSVAVRTNDVHLRNTTMCMSDRLAKKNKQGRSGGQKCEFPPYNEHILEITISNYI